MEDKCHRVSTEITNNTVNVEDTKEKVKVVTNRTIRVEVAKPAVVEANHTKTREVVSTSKSRIRDLKARCHNSSM